MGIDFVCQIILPFWICRPISSVIKLLLWIKPEQKKKQSKKTTAIGIIFFKAVLLNFIIGEQKVFYRLFYYTIFKDLKQVNEKEPAFKPAP